MHAFLVLVLDGGEESALYCCMGQKVGLYVAKRKIMYWIVPCVLVIGSEVSCSLCELTSRSDV